MSASRIPTRRPCAANAAARFAVIDDLPTPPLPEATAITRVVGSSWIALSSAGLPPRSFVVSAIRSSGLITSNSSFTEVTPSTAPTSRATCSWKELRSGQPTTVSAIVTDTSPRRDRHVADHVELGDRLAQLGIDHVAERGENGFARRFHETRSVPPPRSATPALRCRRRRSASGLRDRAGSSRARARRSPGSRTRARGRATGRRRRPRDGRP